jgi:hypothetical protein
VGTKKFDYAECEKLWTTCQKYFFLEVPMGRFLAILELKSVYNTQIRFACKADVVGKAVRIMCPHKQAYGGLRSDHYGE